MTFSGEKKYSIVDDVFDKQTKHEDLKQASKHKEQM